MRLLKPMFISSTIALISAGSIQAEVATADNTSSDKQVAVAKSQLDNKGSLPLAGMTVFIDEETGSFRSPTAEEAAALTAELNSVFAPAARTAAADSTAPLNVQTSASGVKRVKLGLSQLMFSTATVGTDGMISRACNHEPGQAVTHIHSQIAQTEEK